jgi:hypothetical protein
MIYDIRERSIGIDGLISAVFMACFGRWLATVIVMAILIFTFVR